MDLITDVPTLSRSLRETGARVDGINVHVYPSDMTLESRILRITRTLANAGLFQQIHLVGVFRPGLSETEVLDGARRVQRVPTKYMRTKGKALAKICFLAEWMLRTFWMYKDQQIACVNAHSLTVLPLALAFKLLKKCPVIYDTHELESQTAAASGLRRRMASRLEKLLIPFVDETVVVGKHIGDWYRDTYQLERVWVIRSYPYRRHEVHPRLGDLRRDLGLDGSVMLFVYQGLLSPDRSIEVILEAFAGLGPESQLKHVVFMGTGPLEGRVKEYVQKYPHIHYHSPVHPHDVVRYVSGADATICLTENVSLSQYYSCPNKMLEGLAAGRPVIVSDFPEMAAIIKDGGAGWPIEPGVSNLRSLVASLTPDDLAKAARNAERWTEQHNWEGLEDTLLRIYHAALTSLDRSRPAPSPLRSMEPQPASYSISTGRHYQVCVRCIMDTSDPDIEFDVDGICGHCRRYIARVANEVKPGEAGRAYLDALVERIKADGANKEYDCIAGVSGGVDSTNILIELQERGLRPLAVHFDNGWNSELAVANISNALDKLKIPLQTYVVDWDEFRDLQLAFIEASVPNWEIPTDHAIHAVLLRTAMSYGTRYVIGGGNIATEGIMPQAWSYFSPDTKHLKAIHRQFGSGRLRTFPTLPEWQFLYAVFAKRVRIVPILNYLDYNKAAAVERLKTRLGWRPYGAKHFESIFTRFYQGYVLPRKFGFDKRRAHFSCLIMSGQMSREEALAALERDPYEGHDLKADLEYVLKKLRLSQKDFDRIMATAPRPHTAYPSNAWLFLGLKRHRERFRRAATQVDLGLSRQH